MAAIGYSSIIEGARYIGACQGTMSERDIANWFAGLVAHVCYLDVGIHLLQCFEQTSPKLRPIFSMVTSSPAPSVQPPLEMQPMKDRPEAPRRAP